MPIPEHGILNLRQLGKLERLLQVADRYRNEAVVKGDGDRECRFQDLTDLIKSKMILLRPFTDGYPCPV